MPETDAMKYIIFLLTTLSFQFVLGVQAFNGYLNKKGDGFFFKQKNAETIYAIIPASSDVQDSLNRLENGDLIAGNGTLDNVNKKLSIETVDYVGLRKLLGPWVGTEGTVLFRDFSNMSFTPRFRDIKLDSRLTNYQKEFRYSVTPSDGNEWALFLSDDKSTTFATVEFAKSKVIMKIFESESGKIVRTLKLERP